MLKLLSRLIKGKPTQNTAEKPEIPVAAVAKPEIIATDDPYQLPLEILVQRLVSMIDHYDALGARIESLESTFMDRVAPDEEIWTRKGDYAVVMDIHYQATVIDPAKLREVLGEDGFADLVEAEITYRVKPNLRRLAMRDGEIGDRLREGVTVEPVRVLRYLKPDRSEVVAVMVGGAQ